MLLVLMLVTFVWAYLRGAVAETEERNPAGPADPPVSQLYRNPDGHVAVRAAVVVPRPREKVWAVVRDFDHYGDVLGAYLKDVKATPAEGGGWAVSGEAKSMVVGYWKFEMLAHEDRKGSGPWRLWWKEESGGEVRLNNGGWTLTELSPDETLLVLELEAEVRGAPTWLLRNFFLYRLRDAVARVKDHLTKEE
jgi:uncharacterized membrane protein